MTKPPTTRDLIPATTPGGPSLAAALSSQAAEIGRFLELSKSWSREEIVRVLIGHLGTVAAKEMNDFLEKRG